MPKQFGADFNNALSKVLNDYSTDLRTQINAFTRREGKRMVKGIKAHAKFSDVSSGKQAKSWRLLEETIGLDVRETAYSTDYRKTHLLENGHVIRDGTTRRGKDLTKAFHFVEEGVRDVVDNYVAGLTEVIEGVKE